MFWKLIKHEFGTMLRVLLPTLLSVLGLGLLTRAAIWMMSEYEDNGGLSAFGGTMITAMILGSIAAFILIFVFLIIRYVKSALSDEGYLTHTLPVGVNSVLASRLVVAVVCLLVTAVTVFVSLFIAFYRNEFVEGVQSVLRIFGADQGEIISLVLKWLGNTALGMLTSLLMFYAAFSIGFAFANHKGGMSVVFIFTLYFGQAIINAIINLFTLVSNFDSLTEGSVGAVYDDSMLVSLIMNLLFGALFYFLSWLMLKKRLNLA